MSMHTEGLDKLINGLAALDVDAAVQKGLMRTGGRIQRSAKRLCPVDTGQLRSSIYVNKISEGVEVGAAAEHAVYVEYGTGKKGEAAGIGTALNGNTLSYSQKDYWRYKTKDGQWISTQGQAPQPFLYPAVKANQKYIIKDMEYALQRAVKEALDSAESN